MGLPYNGQSRSEFEKNFQRIQNIIEKSQGNHDQSIKLSNKQAKLIKDEFKAINRAFAAKELGQDHIFEIFFQRAYELGSVGKQEYREYKLSKIGL